jgi:hypothetical protein
VTELERVTTRFLNQVSHWTPPRWAASSVSSPGRTRGDVVHALVQRIADLAAAAEGRPPRPVPRLEHDAGLPDQLRVVAADLAAAGPEPAVLARAVELVAAVRREL